MASGWDSPRQISPGPRVLVQCKTPRPVFSVEAATVIYCVRGFINELFNFRLNVYRFQFLNLENGWRRKRLKNASYSNFIYRELHIITPRQVTDAWGRLGQYDTLESVRVMKLHYYTNDTFRYFKKPSSIKAFQQEKN